MLVAREEARCSSQLSLQMFDHRDITDQLKLLSSTYHSKIIAQFTLTRVSVSVSDIIILLIFTDRQLREHVIKVSTE